MKKALLSIFFILVTIGLGAGITFSVWAIKTSAPADDIAKEDRLAKVSVQILETETVEDRLFLSGVIEAWKSITISAEISGKIEWQGVEEGDLVAAEEELIRINTTSIRARMAQARAQHKLSQQELDRVQRLQQGGISSPQEHDRVMANHEATLAALTLAEIELDHSGVAAQFTGIIDRLFKEEGEYVTTGTPLVRLVQVDRVKLVTGLPERDMPHFEVGDRVRVLIDAFPNRVFEGDIDQIATTAELSTRTFAAEVGLENEDGLLRPGMLARAIFVRRFYDDAITIPLFAVTTFESGKHVFVEQDGYARFRRVELGFFQGDRVSVLSGLNAGDRLIVTGQRDLRDGQRVAVRN